LKHARKADIWPLLQLDTHVDIVDIGANPIDGPAIYEELLKTKHTKLVAFEPQKEGFDELKSQQRDNMTILPLAVGDGTTQTFHRCYSPGMSSTLKPDMTSLHYMQGYQTWGQVLETSTVDTVRLDDIQEITNIDFLKIDIQGGELKVFQNGLNRLSDAVLIQTEVSFNNLYHNEPLFSDIDQHLRKMGFVFHTFESMLQRCFTPVIVNDDIFQGNKQIFQADAVYVKDYRALSRLSSLKQRKLAYLLHELYFSFDLVQVILHVHDTMFGTDLRYPYLNMNGIQCVNITPKSPLS